MNMAALSDFLYYLYAIIKLFFALLYLDLLSQFRSITALFTRRKKDPTTSAQTQFRRLVEEAIPAVRYVRRNSGDECSVCLGQIGDGDTVRELRCKHLFHRDCVDGWLNRGRGTCPVCRNRALAEEVVADFQNQVGSDQMADEEMALLLSLLHGAAGHHRSYRFM